MRTPTVIGAALLLVAGLAAPAAAAVPATHPGGDDRGGGSHSSHHRDRHGWDDDKVGGRWDGGYGDYDGIRFRWPENTRSYEGNVCPDMDVAKTDVSGDRKTITLTAPEGMLISAYCVKSGSSKQDLGPKIVELETPVASLPIAYPVEGRCKGISHYSVAYVDAEQETTPPAETQPAPSESPDEATPVTDTETTPPAESQPAPSESPDEDTPLVETEDDDTPGSGVVPDTSTPSPSPVAETVVQDAETVSNRVSTQAETVRDAPVTDAPSALALTGPQVSALVLAALALVGVGVGAVMTARRRRQAQA